MNKLGLGLFCLFLRQITPLWRLQRSTRPALPAAMAGMLGTGTVAGAGLCLCQPLPDTAPQPRPPRLRRAEYQRNNCFSKEMITAMPQRALPIFVWFPFILPVLKHL